MLRRFVCVLSSLALIMSLCACGNIKVPFKAEPFSCAVSFQSAGTIIKGELVYNSHSDISFTVSEPENIKGLCFKNSDGDFSAGVENIKVHGQKEKGSPVYHLFFVLSQWGSSDMSLPLKGDYTAHLDSGKVTMDCAAGKIVLVETENHSFKFE